MVSPFLYDTKKTLTSKTVLIIMAAMISVSLLVFPSFIGNSIEPNNGSTSQLFVYYDSNGYHFTAFAWDKFGQPVSGIKFDINASVPTFSSSVTSVSGVTNSSGSSQFTMAVSENNNYPLSVVVTSPNSHVLASGTYIPFSSDTLPGQTVSIFKATRNLQAATPQIVTERSNASSRDILVSWADYNCSPPIGYHVYCEFVSGSSSSQEGAFVEKDTGVPAESLIPPALDLNASQLLGTMSSYIEVFHAPQFEGNVSDASDTILVIGLTYPNRTSVTGSTSSIQVAQIYPSVETALKVTQNNQVAVSFFEDIFGLFIPLLAIVATYNLYGKDRISGVFDSVLAQPVTRKGLSLSRYASIFTGLSVSILASSAVLDVIANYFSQAYVNLSILMFSTLGLIVELAAFIGIMMFLSHFVRSSGALIGLGVGLFLVIDFFQGLIVSLLTSLLGIQTGSVGFYQLSVGLQFANPSQFVSLVDTYLTSVYRTGFIGIPTGSFPITPGAYGITIPTIFAAGIFWIFVPLVCFLYLATKRD
jgi:ABC-type transport system involved in multi-copper enzyme maturation permease subunit